VLGEPARPAQKASKACSILLDGRKQYFDFVIFDEASQVLPEDAVPALLRGKGVVVAGDNKQLPPTTFFAAGDDDDYSGEEATIAAMNAHPDQQHLIKAEASKTRRHLPLRKIFAQASEVLTAVCPCWMASPLAVSQLRA
jgi:AAA domain-containing protein